MQLRPYQNAAVEAVFREWASGHRKTVLVQPTGTGKTIVFAKIAEECVRRGQRVLILAHRGELLQQAADKLNRATGLMCSVEKAELSCLDEWYQVTVGSVQSMQRPNRLAKFKRDWFDVIIIDECHHALANGYQVILEHFDKANVLGVTATPDRGDMRELGEWFDSLAAEYTLPAAIREGYLAPIKALTIPLQLDLRGVSMQSGDFKAAEVSSAIEPYLEQIAEHMREHCAGRKAVVFLPLIATSQKMCGILQAHGFRAAEVNGESQDRAEVLRDFDAGRYDVLCNSMLLTEGWDCPSVDTIVCLRPTKIRSLYCQIVGRGTRIHPGKDHLLLLDFLWMSERHELCRPAHLIATNAEVATLMTEAINTAGCAVDIQQVEAKAESDAVAKREEALAKKLAEMRKRKMKLVDPLQFEMSIQAEDLVNYVPAFGWEMDKPSTKTKEALEKAGIFPDEIETAGKAEALLSRVRERQYNGLATAKQIRFLEGKGFLHVGTWQFEHARRLIDRIAANGWATPRGITPESYRPADAQREIAV